ncbi:MAG: hypothetical protein R3C51_01950 [Parvularculaceae bacterium]
MAQVWRNRRGERKRDVHSPAKWKPFRREKSRDYAIKKQMAQPGKFTPQRVMRYDGPPFGGRPE